ncbi:hypothetical protein M427DRAFT_158650 [Gonapodya prolifera JEL478]|uniref:SH3 domain-containing protein n=1 Tax=Gonapodya prolifera (strain JEL478) TaxID=1344416 RepID=A0A139A3J9_GONPJ|nr:hypothetical protein M427DRAFT_158650 [Gonapodya prolifera JEL478]|eukprot:KXS10953.1 hypothetical protein M427DRAFT_158650 [Gonapodya prolifera JEL478]
MMPEKNRLLIDAIEMGNTPLVKRLLAEGADPNARKKVTLVCDVRIGRRPLGKVKVKSSKLFGDVYEDRFENIVEQKTDTILGETALAVAIFSGRMDIIHILLDAGADPNMPVEWQNANTVPAWSPARWNDTRWVRTYTAESPLLLAVGRCIKVTDFDGESSAWAALAEKGKLRVNKMGGEVRLLNPEAWTQAYRECELFPRIDIVEALLRRGAKVTKDICEAARRAEDTRVLELLQPRALDLGLDTSPARGSIGVARRIQDVRSSPSMPPAPLPAHTAPPAEPTPGHGDMALSRLLVDQMRQNEELRKEIRNLHMLSAERAAHTAALEHRANQLQERNGDLERELGLTKRILAEQISRMHMQAAATPQDGSRPRDVKRLMQVVSGYVPKEQDEIQLDLGQTVFVNWEYEDGWGAGLNTTTGESGLFPMSCVATPSTTIGNLGVPVVIGDRSVSNNGGLTPPPPYIPPLSSPSQQTFIPTNDLFAAVMAMQAAAEAKGTQGTERMSPTRSHSGKEELARMGLLPMDVRGQGQGSE